MKCEENEENDVDYDLYFYKCLFAQIITYSP